MRISDWSPDVCSSDLLQYGGGRSMEGVLKAAVAAGNTIDSTWAKPLVEYVNYAGDFVDFLRPRTILGRFGAGGIPSLRRIPFNVHIKGQTVGGTGYGVGEGKPTPGTKLAYKETDNRWEERPVGEGWEGTCRK